MAATQPQQESEYKYTAKVFPVKLYDCVPITADESELQHINLCGAHVVSFSIDPAFGEFEVYDTTTLLGKSINGTFHFQQPADATAHKVYDHLKKFKVPDLGVDIPNLCDLSIKMIQHPDHPVAYLCGNTRINLLVTKLNFYLVADGACVIRYSPA